MSEPQHLTPHTVEITEHGNHEPLPVVIPNSLTVDGHEIGQHVQVGGWSLFASQGGETILGLLVNPYAVGIDEDGTVYLDGHPLCWAPGYDLQDQTEVNPDTGETVVTACMLFMQVADAVVRRVTEGATQAVTA